MIELKGKHAAAHVYTSEIDDTSASQLQQMLDHEAFAGLKVRIMPDVHAGKGSVVGFTSELGERLIPNVIGVDIGCGVRLDSIAARPGSWTFDSLEKTIRTLVPSGMAVRRERYPGLRKAQSALGAEFAALEDEIVRVCQQTGQNIERVICSLGTLGGGNHFLEIDRGSQGELYLSIHCGSRNFGLQIANFHQQKAIERFKHNQKLPEKFNTQLAWLEGEDAQAYARDMSVAQAFASLNRKVILEILGKALNWNTGTNTAIESVHNYIDFDEGYIRKGAISASSGRPLVIPISMSEGIILGHGKGNPEWNLSAPHGAGRKLSRTQAKARLSMKDYKESMSAVWSHSVNTATLDEAPMAYKGLDAILHTIGDTVNVQEVLKPVYNFKAAE